MKRIAFLQKKKGIQWLAIGVGCWLFMACGRSEAFQNAERQETSGSTSAPFTDDIRLKTTPVKDQGKGSLCWIYAMLATIETEHLMMGDSVNLSPVFLARQYLTDLATDYYLTRGRTSLSLRGMAPTTIRLINDHGAQPFDYYQRGTGCVASTLSSAERVRGARLQNVNWQVVANRVAQVGNAAIARRLGLDAFRRNLDDILDRETEPMARYVHMLGVEYTSEEFGRSVCMPDEYDALTSFTHHPWGERFAMEVPDNRFGETFLNVPIDTLMAVIDRSLRNGHAVCWEGDISERGFSFQKGVAEIEYRGARYEVRDTRNDNTQEARQKQFESFKTTDDHCMALVGLAHDANGRRYYIAKNSWGTGNAFGGFMYLSEDYLRLKTICVVVPFRSKTHLLPLN